jgi:TRAP-type transport system periplasmic protein
MKPFALQAALVLAVAVHIGAAPAQAADEIVAKTGSVAPEGTPWTQWMDGVKARMEKDSAGKMKMKMFHGGKLGGEKEMVEQAKKGTLHVFGGSAGALAAQYVPELNVLELPFLFESDAEVDFVLDKIRPQVSKLLAERGFVFMMWSENGWHGYGSKGKCVMTPDDLKGLKMRSQESSIHLDTYKAFGASPVEIPVPEVLSALQQGTVDGYSNTPLFSWATSWKDGVKSFAYTKHIYQPALLVASKKWFDGLPKEVQTSLTTPLEEKSGLAGVRDLTPILLANMKDAGLTVCEPSAEQRKAFQAKVKPVWDAFAKKSKANKQILDTVVAAKAEFAAGKK